MLYFVDSKPDAVSDVEVKLDQLWVIPDRREFRARVATGSMLNGEQL
jgi:hypothetical protein